MYPLADPRAEPRPRDGDRDPRAADRHGGDVGALPREDLLRRPRRGGPHARHGVRAADQGR